MMTMMMMMIMMVMMIIMFSGGWLDGDCHYITEDWNCMCKITTTADTKRNPTTEFTVPTETTTTTQLARTAEPAKMETSPWSECGEGWQYGSYVDVWSGNCYWLMRYISKS